MRDATGVACWSKARCPDAALLGSFRAHPAGRLTVAFRDSDASSAAMPASCAPIPAPGARAPWHTLHGHAVRCGSPCRLASRQSASARPRAHPCKTPRSRSVRRSRAPTAREPRRMGDLVEQAVREGSVGFSTGLIHPPSPCSPGRSWSRSRAARRAAAATRHTRRERGHGVARRGARGDRQRRRRHVGADPPPREHERPHDAGRGHPHRLGEQR